MAVPGVIIFLFSLGYWQREIFDSNIESAIYGHLQHNNVEGNQYFGRIMRRAIVLVLVLVLEMVFLAIGFVVLEALQEPFVNATALPVGCNPSRAERFLTCVLSLSMPTLPTLLRFSSSVGNCVASVIVAATYTLQ